ncbi:MAG: hypothetical protein R2817_11805 [Flavobacteriales bacterium]
MSLRFDDGDAPYLKWLADHPRGYVVNTRRIAEQGDMVVHRANCAHIRTLRNARGAEGFTTGSWVKYCSDDLSSLLRETLASRRTPQSIIRRCKACEATAVDIHPERNAGEHHWSADQPMETISVNARERDPLNRSLCFARHGWSCAVCGMDPVQRYGTLAEGFIEAHERYRPFDGDQVHEFDPARDLVPVCPTCHALLHRGRTIPLGIEELRKAMQHTLHQHLRFRIG